MIVDNYKFFIDKNYSFIADSMRHSKFSRSFLNDKFKNLEEWKSETREFIKERFYYSPSSGSFNEEILEEVDFGDYTRQKVTFESAPGCRIPAYVLIPKGLKKPAPAVIVLHDHGGMFYWGKEKSVEHKECNPILKRHIDLYYSGKPLASELARRGYVSIVIDSLFFGERRWPVDSVDHLAARLEKLEFESEDYLKEYNAIEQEIEGELVKAVFYAGHTFMGIRMWDDMASVNYICSRPEVDPQRIGCIGLSMGGHRSGWLAAMDERIKCAAVAGWMAKHEDMLKHRLSNIAWMWNVPGIHEALDYPDVVSLAAPRPLMVLHGEQDDLFPYKTGQKAMEVIGEVYHKAGCGQNFVKKIYDVPHQLNSKMQADAYVWFDMYLK